MNSFVAKSAVLLVAVFGLVVIRVDASQPHNTVTVCTDIPMTGMPVDNTCVTMNVGTCAIGTVDEMTQTLCIPVDID